MGEGLELGVLFGGLSNSPLFHCESRLKLSMFVLFRIMEMTSESNCSRTSVEGGGAAGVEGAYREVGVWWWASDRRIRSQWVGGGATT